MSKNCDLRRTAYKQLIGGIFLCHYLQQQGNKRKYQLQKRS